MGVNDLDRREKGTIAFALLFLALALFMVFYVPNTWGKRYHGARQRVADKQQELQLAHLEKLEEEERVRSQEELLAILQARDPRFELFSFVNRIAGETGLSGRARLENREASRRPRGFPENHPLVDLELSGVSLEELIDLLYKVRSSNNLVAVYKLEIEPMLRDQGLHCDITFVSVKV